MKVTIIYQILSANGKERISKIYTLPNGKLSSKGEEFKRTSPLFY